MDFRSDVRLMKEACVSPFARIHEGGVDMRKAYACDGEICAARDPRLDCAIEAVLVFHAAARLHLDEAPGVCFATEDVDVDEDVVVLEGGLVDRGGALFYRCGGLLEVCRDAQLSVDEDAFIAAEKVAREGADAVTRGEDTFGGWGEMLEVGTVNLEVQALRALKRGHDFGFRESRVAHHKPI